MYDMLLLIYLFTALAGGGAVVISQLIGKNDLESANNSVKQLIWVVTSVAVLLYVMQNIKKEALPFDVCFCACVQEEVGRRGAASAASIIDPVFAVAVDVCHASTPDASSDTFKSGSGTVISRGPNIHPKLLEHTLDILDKSKIKYNIDVDCDDTGTDAWAIQVAKCGIPTILFSLPLRYMHTMVETVNFDDVKSTADAITALITNTKDAEAVVCMD